jgi:hypothetical protein
VCQIKVKEFVKRCLLDCHFNSSSPVGIGGAERETAAAPGSKLIVMSSRKAGMYLAAPMPLTDARMMHMHKW